MAFRLEFFALMCARDAKELETRFEKINGPRRKSEVTNHTLDANIRNGIKADAELRRRLSWDKKYAASCPPGILALNPLPHAVSFFMARPRASIDDIRTDLQLQEAIAIGIDAELEQAYRQEWHTEFAKCLDAYRRMHKAAKARSEVNANVDAFRERVAAATEESETREVRLKAVSNTLFRMDPGIPSPKDPECGIVLDTCGPETITGEIKIVNERKETSANQMVCDFLNDMIDEGKRAEATHDPYNSYHEAYAVILEELDEFWEIVRQKSKARDPVQARKELVQIAVTACRAAKDLGLTSGATKT